MQEAIADKNKILSVVPSAVINTPLESIVRRCLESDWNRIASCSNILALFEGILWRNSIIFYVECLILKVNNWIAIDTDPNPFVASLRSPIKQFSCGQVQSPVYVITIIFTDIISSHMLGGLLWDWHYYWKAKYRI